jgi:uncharacterized protein YndB with AHSA1/START domain/effector-binding domain-containing protein
VFYPDSFKVSTPSDREIQVTRDFDAPRQLVFDAFTKPDLVSRWLLGPPGWTMPVCDIDLKVGGKYRYVWRKPGVPDMGMGGVFREIVSPARLVATEEFDESWYPGEALDTTVFAEQGGITKITITVLYESKEARDTARRSRMEHGMAAGYNRLDELLSSCDAAIHVDAATHDPATHVDTATHLIDTPQITQTTVQLAAVIHLTIPRSGMRSAMGPGLAEVMAAVKAQGIGPAGPWFTHHLNMKPATFDFEICVPVTAPVAPMGRVKPGIFPAVTVARTIYCGNYERLGEAWGEFKAWIAANGHSAGPDLYECYAVGPESSPNPADWRTQLSQPLIARHS